jgi:hypothetical protein
VGNLKELQNLLCSGFHFRGYSVVVIYAYAAEKPGEYCIQYPDLAAASLLEFPGDYPEKYN